jgi:hypothetical protein
MPQSKPDGVVDVQTADAAWAPLYRIGAVAPWITLASYLTEVVVIILGETYPATMADWFALLQRDKILGLLYLNALDTFSIALLGLMFVAVCVALRRVNPSFVAIAAFFALLGIAVFVSTRAAMVSGLLNLTDQYAAAATEAQRAQLLIAGDAIVSPTRATPQTTGFFFIAVAALIISLVDRRGETLGKAAAYVGILAALFTFVGDICLIVAPSIAGVLMPVGMLLWPAWWFLVSLALFRKGR